MIQSSKINVKEAIIVLLIWCVVIGVTVWVTSWATAGILYMWICVNRLEHVFSLHKVVEK